MTGEDPHLVHQYYTLLYYTVTPLRTVCKHCHLLIAHVLAGPRLLMLFKAVCFIDFLCSHLRTGCQLSFLIAIHMFPISAFLALLICRY